MSVIPGLDVHTAMKEARFKPRFFMFTRHSKARDLIDRKINEYKQSKCTEA